MDPPADQEAFAHASATSKTFAPAGTAAADGSNQSSKASLAFRTASSSVSPAEAHPGSSGKKAAHRLVWGSCSNTNRSFMQERILHRESCSNLEFLREVLHEGNGDEKEYLKAKGVGRRGAEGSPRSHAAACPICNLHSATRPSSIAFQTYIGSAQDVRRRAIESRRRRFPVLCLSRLILLLLSIPCRAGLSRRSIVKAGVRRRRI